MVADIWGLDAGWTVKIHMPDGSVAKLRIAATYKTDLYAAGAILFDVYENQDARLVSLQIPDDVVGTFPGPAYGPLGVRERTGFAADQPAFGTILKPTAGITPKPTDSSVEPNAMISELVKRGM